MENVMKLLTSQKIILPKSVVDKILCGGFSILQDALYIPDKEGFGISYKIPHETFKTLKYFSPAPAETIVNEMLTDIALALYRQKYNSSWIEFEFHGSKSNHPILKVSPMSDSQIKQYVSRTIKESLKKNKRRYKDFEKKDVTPMIIEILKRRGIVDNKLNPLCSKERFNKFIKALVMGSYNVQTLTCSYCKKKFASFTTKQINLSKEGGRVYCCPSHKAQGNPKRMKARLKKRK